MPTRHCVLTSANSSQAGQFSGHSSTGSGS
jgi:hypothetical protein